MGFANAQREQIHFPEATDGAFMPAAAKSNGLIAGTTGGASGRTGGANAGDVLVAGVSQV